MRRVKKESKKVGGDKRAKRRERERERGRREKGRQRRRRENGARKEVNRLGGPTRTNCAARVAAVRGRSHVSPGYRAECASSSGAPTVDVTTKESPRRKRWPVEYRLVHAKESEPSSLPPRRGVEFISPQSGITRVPLLRPIPAR